MSYIDNIGGENVHSFPQVKVIQSFLQQWEVVAAVKVGCSCGRWLQLWEVVAAAGGDCSCGRWLQQRKVV